MLVNPSGSSKYLGVTLDIALNWKYHIQNVTTKISKSIGALTSLAGSIWGASVTELRGIYQVVVIPQMMYGCSAWSVAQERGESYTKQTTNSLKKLQAKVASIRYRTPSTSYRAADLEDKRRDS
jgi:hypothetical protein